MSVEKKTTAIDMNAPLAEIEEQKKKAKAGQRLARDKDRKMVKFKFIFHEIPGGCLEFNFRKHVGDPIEKYSLRDGEVYTYPLGVYLHLNQNVSYPTFTYRQNEKGLPMMGIAENIRRCSAQSMEFLDIDEAPIPSALPA
jgi:hypothetical protein